VLSDVSLSVSKLQTFKKIGAVNTFLTASAKNQIKSLVSTKIMLKQKKKKRKKSLTKILIINPDKIRGFN